MTWTRVKDKDTGHEYSVETVLESHEVLSKDAADRFGNPLPAKVNRPLARITADGGKPVDTLTVPELVEFAGLHQIDLGEATRKGDILTVIAAHEQGINPPAV